MRAVVLSLHDVRRGNGGTARTDAFAAALTTLGWDTIYAYPDEGLDELNPLAGVEYRQVASRPVGQRNWPSGIRKLKQTIAPMPTRGGAFSSELYEVLSRLGPIDLLVVPTANAARYARALPTARLWLDFHDLMSAFARREADFLSPLGSATARVQASLFDRQESSCAQTAAIVTAAGFGDYRRLRIAGVTDAEWLPNPIISDAIIPPINAHYAGFLADFGYWPNVDAMKTLMSQWLQPLMRAGWQVVIAGRRTGDVRIPASVRNLGEVVNIADFYRHTEVILVPVRRGGGMKVKLIEALIHGRPVIATAFAAEGFESLPATLKVDENSPLIPDRLAPPTEVERRMLRDRYSAERFCQSIEHLLHTAR